MLRRPSLRRLLQALTVAVSAYYALWACAPPSTFRAMTLDLDHPNEFGLGASGVGTIDDPAACWNGYLACSGPHAQLWYQHRFNQRFSFGGTVFVGQASGLGAGVQARLHWVELDRFRFGTDLEGGFLWGGVGLPVSVRLVDDLWLYSSPAIRANNFQTARLPLGLAWGVTDQFWLQGEAAYGYSFLNSPSPSTSDAYSFGLAGSFRF